MTTSTRSRKPNSRGGALLAVLWLSAALSAIAFSVATTVRGEIDRSSTMSDSIRTQYLASGAVHRGILHIVWGPGARNEDGTPKFWEPGLSGAAMQFPTGQAIVEYIPETARLSLNLASAEDFARLLTVLGANAAQAAEIAAAIVDWRRPAPPGALGPFDTFYSTRVPSFRARHASIEETEEILYVKGMTPELFYGNYRRDAQGRLVRLGGFRDCVSPRGTIGTFDAGTAEPALLMSMGVPEQAITQIMRLRRLRPLRFQDLQAIREIAGPGGGKLRSGGNTIYTIRATARLRAPNGQLGDVRRSVSATVKIYQDYRIDPPYQILRWDANAASEVAQW